MAASWDAYLLGPFYSLLPKRWQPDDYQISARFMARCAMVSAFLESAVALVVLRWWYLTVVTALNNAYAEKALSIDPGPLAHIAPELVGGTGFTLIAGNPITWFLFYFAVEGLLRFTVAGVTGESFGTLPLGALEFAFHRTMRGRAGRELPLVPDEVLPGDKSSHLRIASCRKRPEWKYPYAIRYDRIVFQFIAVRTSQSGPRPYVYALRRLPPGEAASGLRDYQPEDVIWQEARVESLL
jgi:hypothetical protein